MSSKDQAKVSRRRINLETVVFSAEQEVTVPARIKIPDSTQYLLQPILMLPKDKVSVFHGPGKIRVQGQLEGILSYVDSAEQVHTLAVPAQEFVAAFTAPALSPGVRLTADVQIDGIEVDQGEGNVANITAYIIINLRAFQTQEVEMVSAVSGGALRAETNSVRLQQVIKEIGAKQTVALLLPTQPEMAPVGTELCIGNLSWQVEEGRLRAAGLVLAKVYCLNGDGEVKVLLGQQDFGLELDFDAPEIGEGSLICSFEKASLANVSEGTALELELVLKATATGYREQMTDYVSSLTGADSQQKTIQLRNRIGEGEFKVTLEGNCPFASQPQAIDQVLPRVRIIESQALEGKILVRGLLTLNIYYTDESDQRRVLVQEEEFSQFFDLEGCVRGYAVKSWAWPEGADCAEGRYAVPVLMRVEVIEEVEFTAVTDVHVVDPSQVPANASVILYMVKTGDSLFSIARKFNTTQELLWEYNGLSEQDGLEPGQKLIIPVYQTRFKVQ